MCDVFQRRSEEKKRGKKEKILGGGTGFIYPLPRTGLRTQDVGNEAAVSKFEAVSLVLRWMDGRIPLKELVLGCYYLWKDRIRNRKRVCIFMKE